MSEFLQSLLTAIASAMGIFAASVGWLIFPLLPIIILGAIFLAARFGVRSAIKLEHRLVDLGRRAIRASASWILRHVAEPSHRNT